VGKAWAAGPAEDVTTPREWLLAVILLAGVSALTWIIARRRRVARLAAGAPPVLDQSLHLLLERADCLLWEAKVELTPAEVRWDISCYKTGLTQRIFGEVPPPNEVGLWYRFKVPERPDMDRRAREALENRRPGYEQQFRLVREDRTFWIHESVTITPAGPNKFWLVGLATDVTVQREADEARWSSQEQLNHLLAHANCMLWQAEVRRDAAGEFHWEWFVPKSALYRRIVGEDPSRKSIMPWGQTNVPEFAELEARSRDAMRRELPGYEQFFRVVQPDGEVLWMHEQARVRRVGENEWSLEGVVIDITAQRRAEEAQRKSEVRLQQLLERADCLLWQGVVSRGPAGELTWEVHTPRSKLSRRLFGEDPDKLVRIDWGRLDVPELPAMGKAAAEALSSGARGYAQVFHVVTPGGDIWLSEQTSITASSPDRWELVGVITDITPQRAAEEAVRASEARYRALFQHTPVAIIEADFSAMGRRFEELRASGVRDIAAWLDAEPRHVVSLARLAQIRSSNETARKILRADSNRDFRHRRHLLETADALRVMREAMLMLWDGRATLDAQVEMRDFEGKMRHMNVRWWIGSNDQGLDLTQTVLVLVDLTELKQTEAALAAEKERLAVTLRAMAEGVVTTDVAGRVQYMNPAASRATDWDGSAFDRPVSEICVFENDRTGAPVEVPIARVAGGDTVADLPAHTRLVSRRGTRRLVEGCCAPIHSADSRVIGMVLVFRDVTEHERLEQELVRAARLESVGVLAGGIAHDFNNILTAVMGNLALALLDAGNSAEASERLRAAEKATLRARDLTQQLLTFAKGGDPVREAVQLATVIRETTDFALHGSSVKAIYHLPVDLWPADVDKGQIARVVQNLVINSIQAMPAGGTLRLAACNEPAGEGHRSGLAPGDYIQLTIADTGEGISAEHLPRIFDPYFTTKRSGSGLGLAAVYSIVKKHAGHISAESTVGQGTTFSLWLPAVRTAPVAAAELPPATRAKFAGRVLFMDDEETIRQMATLLLKRLGFEVECAEEGAEAVEKFRAAHAAGRPFTVVVMDLTVPGGMGGREAIGQLRAIDPQVKAIVSSGYSSDPVLANFRAHGFCSVVAKPYRIEDFTRALREALAETGGQTPRG